jgi:hypothetical protein
MSNPSLISNPSVNQSEGGEEYESVHRVGGWAKFLLSVVAGDADSD